MQVNTGSEPTLIPRNFGLQLCQPRYKKKKHFKDREFDRMDIKTLGTFEVSFATKERFDWLVG